MTPENADLAIFDIIMAGWSLSDGRGDCDQLVDGRWYKMRVGRGSLQASLDVAREFLRQVPA